MIIWDFKRFTLVSMRSRDIVRVEIRFAVRRAAAVVLIYSIKYNKYSKINPYVISDALMTDEHYLVLKGYGWVLKVLSESDPEHVYAYLLKNQGTMPRLAYRYALEKFDKQMKQQLMGN